MRALFQTSTATPNPVCAAANRSVRHSLCSCPQTRPCRLSAQAAPPSAVAELGVGDFARVP